MRTQNPAKFEERRYSPRDSPLRLNYADNRRKRRERTDSYSGGKRQRGGSNTAWSASSTGSSYGGEPDHEKLKRSHDIPYPCQYQKVDVISWNGGKVPQSKKRYTPTNVNIHENSKPAAAIKNPTMVENAWRWFNEVTRKSINGFGELRKAFYPNSSQEKVMVTDSKKDHACDVARRHPRRQFNDHSGQQKRGYRNERRGRGNNKYTPLTKTPREILAEEGANFPKPMPMRTPEEKRVGKEYCEYHEQKGHGTNECVQLRKLIEGLVKEGKLSHLVESMETDTIYMIQSWQRNTKRKISQKFSYEKEISFPALTEENVVAEPLIIEINVGSRYTPHVC